MFESLILLCAACGGYWIHRTSPKLPLGSVILTVICAGGIIMNLVPTPRIAIIAQFTIAMLIGALVAEVKSKRVQKPRR